MNGGYRSESSCGRLRRWTFVITLMVLLMHSGLFTRGVGAEKRTYPIRIGVLTPSWGPTPQVVGLRDGLLELGYREDEQFVIGIRFTQGDLTALPTVARELVQYGVDIIIVEKVYDSPRSAEEHTPSLSPLAPPVRGSSSGRQTLALVHRHRR